VGQRQRDAAGGERPQTPLESGGAGGAVLALNAGSSSLKFALFHAGARLVSGRIERIGLDAARLEYGAAGGGERVERDISAPTHAACVEPLVAILDDRGGLGSLRAIGHRVVHGGPRFTSPQRITPEVMAELRRLSPFDPEHLPAEIALIEAFAAKCPDVPQIACFDTGFHRGMPRVARLLPIPRRYAAQGVERYGFHGLSYAYLLGELERVAGAEAARGRVIFAHLGNGASMAAVRGGAPVDTTMAFTPAAGLVMSTRTGDLDPGLVAYLARTEGMGIEQFHAMVHHGSGLLGVSETSPDVRDLLGREASDVRAAEALALFCYQAKKWIGALAAALGGLDTLVFAGGIGENSAVIRARIVAGLEFLGIDLDSARNAAHAAVVSREGSPVAVRVIPTDEELCIARAVTELLGWRAGEGA